MQILTKLNLGKKKYSDSEYTDYHQIRKSISPSTPDKKTSCLLGYQAIVHHTAGRYRESSSTGRPSIVNSSTSDAAEKSGRGIKVSIGMKGREGEGAEEEERDLSAGGREAKSKGNWGSFLCLAFL